MSTSNQRLHIYKASAGAGKTHTMTEAFLSHVLQYPESSYQEVQAVTFTNLATRELKERFFKELYTLAVAPQESPFYGSFNTQYSDDQLSIKARTALQSILFDYDGLRVKTIDSFFQDIIHALAIELKQRPTTRIELSTDQILGLAVERLFDEPSLEAQEAIKRFLTDQADKSIYALKNGLTLFAKQLYNEQIQELAFKNKQLLNPKTYPLFLKAVRAQINIVKEEIRNQVDAFRAQVIPGTKFPGGQQSPLARLTDTTKDQPTIGATKSYITATTWDKYLRHFNVEEALDERYTKGFEGSPLLSAFYKILPLHTKLFTLQTAIRKGYDLKLLGEIQSNVSKVSEELNITLLDNAKQLIRTLVGREHSTAFIYERIGTKLKHHMIDEFQDTSRFQYENFKPLLNEALAADGSSFIVGDVKQSIYRFRNSDPMLLQKSLSDDFPEYEETDNLEFNWRSAPAIVSFNNRFFSLLPDASQLKLDKSSESYKLIENIYKASEVHQEVPDKHLNKVGGVFIHQWQEASPQDQLQAKIDYLLEHVIPSLRERGYKLSDIAILTPKNDTLQRIAQSIIQYNQGVPSGQEPLAFVSREMLSLDANPLYRLIVEVMHSVLVNAGAAEELYSKSFEHRLATAHYAVLAHSIHDLPALDLTRCYSEGLGASLYELTLLIIEAVSPLITSADQPYIDALLDTVQDYSQDNYVDLQGFLEWLETHTPRLCLETQDALQLLTIHSAKGLGFPVVCLLEYQWRLLDHNDIIWCDDKEVMDELHKLLGTDVEIPPLLPISSTKETLSTPFRHKIAAEEGAALLDRINTLYVAMTRAKSEMHLILSEKKEKSGKSVNFESVISELVEKIYNTSSSTALCGSKEIPLHCSKATTSLEKVGEVLQCTFYTQTDPSTAPQTQPTTESSTASAPPRRISGREQTSDLAQLRVRRSQSVSYQEQDAVRRGLFLHSLLSEIDYLEHDELQDILQAKCHQGLLPKEQLAPLTKQLEGALADPAIAEYYQPSSKWQVVNERSVVRFTQDTSSETRTARIERPDRIMYDEGAQQAVIIDYKSGDEAQQQTARHKRQLRNYRKALLASGFTTVRAYLLYLSDDGHLVVEVD